MNFYPPAPAVVNPDKLQPSAAFKGKVRKVISSISLFFAAYIIMVILAAALAIGCIAAGIALVMTLPKTIIIFLGLGLVALGVSVFFFLIKFIFAVSKDENDLRVEITESEQPELFEFVRKISRETETPFPKKIFLSPVVNASVFYNSSFWSMFFPVRKNLEIGLGLVNSINISELKAVIAHEFGHFSQRSMKLGSFTYNVNRVIFNMLFENQGYSSFLQSWGNISGVLTVFAGLTVKIAQFIQWVLRGFYQLINKHYMGLSREMEFHADAIAASVSGGNNLVSGLIRLEVASLCYQTAISKANDCLKENKFSRNIFSNQLAAYQKFADEHKLPVIKEIPEISFSFIESQSASRINFQNQWASHPTLEERKTHLESLQMNSYPIEESAWVVFRNPEQLQEQFTAKLYSHLENDQSNITYYDRDMYEAMISQEANRYSLPEAYNGFYDKRFPDISSWNLDQPVTLPANISFEQLFSRENGQLQSCIQLLERDLETVKAIQDGSIDTATFDFDGAKYKTEQCEEVKTLLENELISLKQEQKLLDQQAYAFFAKSNPALRELYVKFQQVNSKHEKISSIIADFNNSIRELYLGENTAENIGNIVSEIKRSHEPTTKQYLRQYLSRTDTNTLSKSHQQLADKFLKSQYNYFDGKEFFNNELDHLIDCLNLLNQLSTEENWNTYKDLITKQLDQFQNMQ